MSEWQQNILVPCFVDFADSLTAELQKEKAEIAKALGIHFCPDLEEPWEVPMEPEPDYFETLPEAAEFLFKLLDKGLSDREAEIARLELELAASEKENARLEKLVEWTAEVLLQHMNDEDYEASIAGIYAKLTESALNPPSGGAVQKGLSKEKAK